MRILWFSHAPFAATGNGTQTAVWLHRLATLGHEVAACGALTFTGALLRWNGIAVYPGWRDGIGNDIVAGHYRHFRADLLITFCDAFVLDPAVIKTMNVMHWMPVDSHPVNWRDRQVLLAGGGRPVAFSRFGQAEITRAGFSAGYIPHGIDTRAFAPGDRAEARARTGIPAGKFVVGINAANIDRKALPEQLAAFAMFHRRHPDTHLAVHSTTTGAADLLAIADKGGFADAVSFPDQHAYISGLIPASYLVSWYNAIDALSSCSYGEGFGLPIVESQSCGTPVVVTDCSSMSELAGPGIRVSGARAWVGMNRSWWYRPDVGQISEAYERLYCLDSADELRSACREHALAYDADRVLTEYWKPALEEVP